MGTNLYHQRWRQLYGIPRGPRRVGAQQQGLYAPSRNKKGVYFCKSYGCICIFHHGHFYLLLYALSYNILQYIWYKILRAVLRAQFQNSSKIIKIMR